MRLLTSTSTLPPTTPHSLFAHLLDRQILTRRIYENERTVARKSASNQDVHVTVKIVSTHEWIAQICANLGPNLTVGGTLSQSKWALIQRTNCMFARDQTGGRGGSDETEFDAHVKIPEVAERISDFRLFTDLVCFMRLAIQKMEWLQPDTAYAKMLFREWDAMLENKFGMPRPVPRRAAKRMENLITLTCFDAIARVFLFKQSAVKHGVACPDKNGNLPVFDVGDLWEAIRTAVPTREIILDAFQRGLEYTVSTSMHGVNVMTSVCQAVGMSMNNCLRLSPSESPEMLQHNSKRRDFDECESIMQDAQGHSSDALTQIAKALARARERRCEFRRMAEHQPSMDPKAAIHRVVEQRNQKLPPDERIDPREYTNALFPTMVQASLYYKPQALIKWCNRDALDSIDPASQGAFADTNLKTGTRRLLNFYTRTVGNGESKTVDPAWLVVASASEERLAWSRAASKLFGGDTPCTTLGMHHEGVSDTLMQLAQAENSQLCTEMPTVPSDMLSSKMFDDASASQEGMAATKLKLRPFQCQENQRVYEACEEIPGWKAGEDVRLDSHPFNTTRTPMHTKLDRLVGRGRLPALLASVSTKCLLRPPICRMENDILVNASRAFEHAMMVTEAALALQTQPGLTNLQEQLIQNRTGPAGTTAHGWAADAGRQERRIHQLPFSIDLMQIYWGVLAAERLYAVEHEKELKEFNDEVVKESLGDEILPVDMPHLTLRYPGYQSYVGGVRDERTIAVPELLSHPIACEPQADQPEALVEAVSVESSISRAEVIAQTRIGLGRDPDEQDVDAYVRLLSGSNYMHNVTGDIYSFTTWKEFVISSLCSNSNTSFDVEDSGFYEAVLGGETMLYARLLERKCEYQGINPEYKMRMATSGSTYAWKERNEALMTEAQVLRSRRLCKRVHEDDLKNNMSEMERENPGKHDVIAQMERRQKKKQAERARSQPLL
jgi:hypothetical protein